ncbi:MAG TPA: bifunctional serine/threonine-protein kinase/formylglycine-generating enzyme family protein [Terrimicrobiaceae bacterium]
MDTFEHYQLLKNDQGNYIELGRGSMGVTYKAEDTSLRCYVALKVIAASLLGSRKAEERFLREARSAAQLRHRNVASVFHLGKRDESFYYVMEFIDGETVDQLVRRDGRMDCLVALEIAEQVACALIAAEKSHLVHRDIKPSNLMVVRESDGDLLVKVIDFGLVKSAIVQDNSMDALTVGGFVGTPYFASPEQLEQKEEDVRSDIYSLGVTLWYMLTGKPTFSGSVASVIAQHLDRPPPFESLALLPSEVVAVLRQMLEKDVARRVQSPTELRAALKRCIDDLRGSASATRATSPGRGYEAVELSSSRGLSPQPAVGSVPKGRSWLWVTTGIGAAAVLFGGAAAVWKSLDPRPQDVAAPVSAASAKRASKSPAVALSPQRGMPWRNTLDMSFVPLGDIHMAVLETRVRDFEAFVQATDYDAEGGMSSTIRREGFERRNLSWKFPGFPQTPDDPVVGVCWEDADQFCAWLTKRERAEGAITAFQRYRLPTDREWSEAVGLLNEEGVTPEERGGRLKGVAMPPSEGAGNYAGEESRQDAPGSWNFLKGYRDPFPRTAPVEAAPANAFGLRGLGGNVWEWCLDHFNQSTNWRVLRGGSWATSRPQEMLSSYRRGYDPLFRMDDVGFRCVIAPEVGQP